MKQYQQVCQHIGVLSLSMLLTSYLTVSGTLPYLIEEFPDRSRASVEMLISVPSIPALIMLIITPFITRKLSERQLITIATTAVGIGGILPMFVSQFETIFAARILLGAGIGLMDARSVSMVGERYAGRLGVTMQGIRVSMETLGQTLLTFAAGQLLVFGWHASFAVYLIAFVILAWFLAFVKPLDVVGVQGLETGEHVASAQLPQQADASCTLDGRGWLQAVGAALLAVTFFSANTLNSLRIPTLVVDSSFGSSIAGSTALSCCVFAGFLGGISFGVLSRLLKRWHMAVSAAMIAIGMTIVAFAGNILLVVVGSMLVGFSTSNGFALVLNGLSLRFRDRALTLANTVALTGCCAGVAATPYILQMVGMVSQALSAPFLAYTIAFFLLAAGSIIVVSLKK